MKRLALVVMFVLLLCQAVNATPLYYTFEMTAPVTGDYDFSDFGINEGESYDFTFFLNFDEVTSVKWMHFYWDAEIVSAPIPVSMFDYATAENLVEGIQEDMSTSDIEAWLEDPSVFVTGEIIPSITAHGDGISLHLYNQLAFLSWDGLLNHMPVGAYMSFALITNDFGTLNTESYLKTISLENPNPTPEPATIMLLAVGMVGIGFIRRKLSCSQ
jgi:hypothetical protein